MQAFPGPYVYKMFLPESPDNRHTCSAFHLAYPTISELGFSSHPISGSSALEEGSQASPAQPASIITAGSVAALCQAVAQLQAQQQDMQETLQKIYSDMQNREQQQAAHAAGRSELSVSRVAETLPAGSRKGLGVFSALKLNLNKIL